MRKVFLFIVAFALVAVAIFGFSATAYAYTGVQGRVVDVHGDPWVHGGTVAAYEMGNGTPVATGSLQADGSFSIPYSTTPSSGMMYVVINYNPAAHGEPTTSVHLYYERTDSGVMDLGTISTGTGPTAISLQSVAASAQPTALPLALAGIAAIVLAGTSLFVARRRFALSSNQ